MRKIVLRVLKNRLPNELIRVVDSYIDFIAKTTFQYKKIRCKTRHERRQTEHHLVRRRRVL